MRSNNNNKLKAFVRFDGSGRIIPGSLNVQSIKPKVGNWRQINAKECCLNTECAAPIYYQDWVLDGIDDAEGGLIFNFFTNPFENFTMQVQFTNCETGQGIGEIITIGPDTNYEYSWFVSNEILDITCGFKVKHICGPDFTSDWDYSY